MFFAVGNIHKPLTLDTLSKTNDLSFNDFEAFDIRYSPNLTLKINFNKILANILLFFSQLYLHLQWYDKQKCFCQHLSATIIIFCCKTTHACKNDSKKEEVMHIY